MKEQWALVNTLDSRGFANEMSVHLFDSRESAAKYAAAQIRQICFSEGPDKPDGNLIEEFQDDLTASEYFHIFPVVGSVADPAMVHMARLDLPFELALIRWSVVHMSWNALASGSMPILAAFLAGWCLRCIGSECPKNVGTFRESFRAGWAEADDQIAIELRKRGGE